MCLFEGLPDENQMTASTQAFNSPARGPLEVTMEMEKAHRLLHNRTGHPKVTWLTQRGLWEQSLGTRLSSSHHWVNTHTHTHTLTRMPVSSPFTSAPEGNQSINLINNKSMKRSLVVTDIPPTTSLSAKGCCGPSRQQCHAGAFFINGTCLLKQYDKTFCGLNIKTFPIWEML